MSGLKLASISAAETEFIGEESIITVTSGFDHSQFLFISGAFGPLRAGFPCDLPLWFAITLRKKNKCTIQVPDWMTVEYLSEAIQKEKTSNVFEELPFHYIEISQLLLQHAREDVPNADEVAVLLQDLENIRMDRIKMGLLLLSQKCREGEQIQVVNLPNVSAAELAATKRMFIGTLGLFWQLVRAPAEDTAAGRRAGIGAGRQAPQLLRGLQQSLAAARRGNSGANAMGAFADESDGAMNGDEGGDASVDPEGGRQLRRFRS